MAAKKSRGSKRAGPVTHPEPASGSETALAGTNETERASKAALDKILTKIDDIETEINQFRNVPSLPTTAHEEEPFLTQGDRAVLAASSVSGERNARSFIAFQLKYLMMHVEALTKSDEILSHIGSLHHDQNDIAAFFRTLDLSQYPIWNQIKESHPGAEMFAFYVPPKWIDQDGKGGFTACGEALISIPAKRRNGTLDRAPLTIDVAIKGRTDDGIAVDAIVLV